MDKELTFAPIDETNVCGSAILECLQDEYEATMSKDVRSTTYAAVFVGTDIVRLKWAYGYNIIHVWGDNEEAIRNVVMKLKEFLGNDFVVESTDEGEETLLFTYWKE